MADDRLRNDRPDTGGHFLHVAHEVLLIRFVKKNREPPQGDTLRVMKDGALSGTAPVQNGKVSSGNSTDSSH